MIYSRETAYKVLGLAEGASQTEIKKAYRKMAVKFHPDKNPDEDATEKFLFITEAYEILTNKKPLSRRTKANNDVQEPSKRHPKDPEEFRRMQWEVFQERMKEAKRKWEEQKIKEEIENQRYFERITSGNNIKIFYFSLVCSLIMCFAFTYDYFAKGEIKEMVIEDISISSTPNLGGKDFFYMLDIKGYNFYVSPEIYTIIYFNPEIKVEFSPLFKDIKRIYVTNNYGEQISQAPAHSLMFFFPLIQIVLLIPLLAFFLMKPTPLFGFLYFVSIYAILPLIVVLLYLNDRFLHMTGII